MLKFNEVGTKPSVLLSLVQFSLAGASPEGGVSLPKLAAYNHLRKSFPTSLITRSIQSENDATFLIEALLGDDVRTEANELVLAIDATPHLVKSNSFLGVIEAESRSAKRNRLKSWAFFSSTSSQFDFELVSGLSKLEGGDIEIGKVIRLLDPRTPLVVTSYFDSLEVAVDFHQSIITHLKKNFEPRFVYV